MKVGRMRISEKYIETMGDKFTLDMAKLCGSEHISAFGSNGSSGAHLLYSGANGTKHINIPLSLNPMRTHPICDECRPRQGKQMLGQAAWKCRGMRSSP